MAQMTVRKWYLIAGLAAIVIAGVWIAINISDPAIIYYQDELSHSVMAVKQRSLLALLEKEKRKIVFHASAFDSSKAIWHKGIQFSFPKVLATGDNVIILCKDNMFLIKFNRIVDDNKVINISVRKIGTDVQNNLSLSENQKIAIDGCNVMWSWVWRNGVILYSDEFWHKEESLLYKIAFNVGSQMEGDIQFDKMQFVTYPWQLR